MNSVESVYPSYSEIEALLFPEQQRSLTNRVQVIANQSLNGSFFDNDFWSSLQVPENKEVKLPFRTCSVIEADLHEEEPLLEAEPATSYIIPTTYDEKRMSFQEEISSPYYSDPYSLASSKFYTEARSKKLSPKESKEFYFKRVESDNGITLVEAKKKSLIQRIYFVAIGIIVVVAAVAILGITYGSVIPMIAGLMTVGLLGGIGNSIITKYALEKNEEGKSNRKCLEEYREFLLREIGAYKFQQICDDYGIDFSHMLEEGKPLTPELIYKFNIGANNLETGDIQKLRDKLINLSINLEDRGALKAISALDFLVDLRIQGTDLTNREIRGLLRLIGKEATAYDLVNKVINPLNGLYGRPLNELRPIDTNTLIEILSTPSNLRDEVYTGRKIDTAIHGAYNGDLSEGSSFQPWIDQHELYQSFTEFKYAETQNIYNELILKVAVKKHLMRLNHSNYKWRVGALIPAPSSKGEMQWYQVDEAADSGMGKLWVVLRPLNEKYNESLPVDKKLPVIRAYRDTSPDPYAQAGAYTVLRSLHPTLSAGYYGADSTSPYDELFYKRFTTPVWVAQFLTLVKDKAELNHLEQLQKMENIFVELKHYYQQSNPDLLDKEKRFTSIFASIKALRNRLELKETRTSDEAEEMIQSLMDKLNSFGEKEGELENFTLAGKENAPLHLLGNSLGGFDAQYDLKAQTVDKGRILITPTELYCHSALRMEKQDIAVFNQFVEEHADLMASMGGSLKTETVLEDIDPVPRVGKNHAYIGQGLNEMWKNNLSARVTVFHVNANAKHKELQQPIHIRKLERPFIDTEGEEVSVLHNIQTHDDLDEALKALRVKDESSMVQASITSLGKVKEVAKATFDICYGALFNFLGGKIVKPVVRLFVSSKGFEGTRSFCAKVSKLFGVEKKVKKSRRLSGRRGIGPGDPLSLIYLKNKGANTRESLSFYSSEEALLKDKRKHLRIGQQIQGA